MDMHILESIVEELKKKNYIVTINGDKKVIQAILKTNFDNEIVNRVLEIKNVILSVRPDFKDFNKRVEVKDIIYLGNKHKAIMIKYD